LGFTKRAIRRSLDRDMEGEFDYEIFAQVQCLQSNDHREGLAAFREKRAPRFEGK
jgi:2-(1,2-epoxy-1,2-dihydrophenyl)acetyl-CoA isomerase